MTLAL